MKKGGHLEERLTLNASKVGAGNQRTEEVECNHARLHVSVRPHVYENSTFQISSGINGD